MATDETRLQLIYEASADRRSISKTINDFKKLHKQLAQTKIEFGKVDAESQNAIKDIAKLSSAAEHFSGSLSKGAINVGKELGDLKGKIEKARGDAEAMADLVGTAATPELARQADAEYRKAMKNVASLNKEYQGFLQTNKKYGQELHKTLSKQAKYRETLEGFAKFKPSDMGKGLGRALKQALRGDVKGAARGAAGAVGAGARGAVARGGIAKGEAKDTAGMARAAKGLAVASLTLTAVVGGFAAFITLLAKASERMSGLNKELISGIPLAKDWAASAAAVETYGMAVGKMRSSAIANQVQYKKLGSSAEGAMKLTSNFTRESSGSIAQTAETFRKMGGTIEKGQHLFATSAMLYGKALGMEATEVAGMMGKWTTDIGISATSTIDMMSDISAQARTSSMPVHRFMDIFKQTLPSIEQFTNRIEQLTGMIKMLSKTMSPGQVKAFMDAFAKGFRGKSMRDRIKSIAIVGKEKTAQIMTRDLGMQASAMAKDFAEFGINEADFIAAFKKGGKAWQALIFEAQKKGAGGALVGKAMQKQRAQMALNKPTILSLASAVREGSIAATYLHARALSQELTPGFEGISEVVQEQLNLSEGERQSLRNMEDTLNAYQYQLQENGLTISKSVNDGLIKQTRDRLTKDDKHASLVGKDAEELKDIMKEDTAAGRALKKAMQNTSKDELAFLAEQTGEIGDQKVSIEKTAEKQYNLTKSMLSRLGDIFTFLMDKLYAWLLDFGDIFEQLISSLPGWLIGDAASKKQVTAIDNMNKQFQDTDLGGGEEGKQRKIQGAFMAKAMKDGIVEGLSDFELGQKAAKSLEGAQVDKGALIKALEISMAGMDEEGALGKKGLYTKTVRTRIKESKNMGQLMKALETLPGAMGEKIMLATIASGPGKLAKMKAEERAEKLATPEEKAMVEVGEKERKELAVLLKQLSDVETRVLDKGQKDVRRERAKELVAAGAGEEVQLGGKKSQEDLLKELVEEVGDGNEYREKEEKKKKKVAKDTEKSTKASEKELKKQGSEIDNIIKNSTLEAFREALMDFATVLAKMFVDIFPELSKDSMTYNIGRHGREAAGLGMDIGDLTGMKAHDTAEGRTQFEKWIKEKKQNTLTGGTLSETGPYWGHAGEVVLPPGAGATGGLGGGGGNVSVGSINVYESNNPRETARIIQLELSKAFRTV